jgi:Peptidase family M50
MPLALQFIAAIALLAALHTTVMAMLARLLGITVREVSLGFGPTLLSMGIFRLRALPLGGAVMLKNTLTDIKPDDAAPDWADDAFDTQPRAVRVLLPLSGIAALIAVAFALRPDVAWSSLVNGFAQIVTGGLSALSTAQHLLGGATQVASLGFAPLLGMLAAKFAALNLLPLPTMGGGQALLTLLDPCPRDQPRWKELLMQWSAWLAIALGAAWIVAIGVFLAR